MSIALYEEDGTRLGHGGYPRSRNRIMAPGMSCASSISLTGFGAAFGGISFKGWVYGESMGLWINFGGVGLCRDRVMIDPGDKEERSNVWNGE